jgi:hypothetical protein
VRGELVPMPPPFEAEVLDADPRRVKRVKIYRSKNNRPGKAREMPGARAAAARSASPLEDGNRTNANAQRQP